MECADCALHLHPNHFAHDTSPSDTTLTIHQHHTSMSLYAIYSTLPHADNCLDYPPSKGRLSYVPPSWCSIIHRHMLAVTLSHSEHTTCSTLCAGCDMHSLFPCQLPVNVQATYPDTTATTHCSRHAKRTLHCGAVHDCCSTVAITTRPPGWPFLISPL